MIALSASKLSRKGSNLDKNNENKENIKLIQVFIPESHIKQLQNTYQLPYKSQVAVVTKAVADLVAIIQTSGLHPAVIEDRLRRSEKNVA